VLAVLAGQWKRMGDRWVFEFAAPVDGFTWAPPPAIEVRLDDGTRHTLALEPGTTASGSIAAGATVRLVVTAVGTQTPIEVRMGDLVIELHA
jgi:hypothetical protein